MDWKGSTKHHFNFLQIEKYIPAMTAGESVGAIAMTEPDAGSDLQGIRTSAKRDGDDFILNGSKVFITNGIVADTCVVVAVTDPNARSKAHGTTLFIVEEGMPGFHKGKNLKKMGLKGQDTAELFFEDVRVPKANILGGENKGFYQLMKELPQERLGKWTISKLLFGPCCLPNGSVLTQLSAWVLSPTPSGCSRRPASTS